MANPLRYPDRDGLGRFHVVSSRLNLQHYLWKETLGFNLHPAICPAPTADKVRIAEIAAGTALWLVEVARALPRAQVDGFDVSSAWAPPRAWMPPNAAARLWDVYDDVPDDLVGRYDLVHVRLINLEVVDDNPAVIARHLSRLLKRGGTIQWDEIDMPNTYILRSDGGGIAAAALDEMKRELVDRMNGWVSRLPAVLEAEGFAHVAVSRYDPEPPFLKYFSDMYLVAMEELAGTMFRDTDLGRRILGWVPALYCNSQEGAVICTPLAVCIGTKV